LSLASSDPFYRVCRGSAGARPPRVDTPRVNTPDWIY
jgi:hypothetical protein